MEVGILGPVDITQGEAHLTVEAPKERALVATLALNVGTPVAPAVLITALWGDDPPATAEKTLQTHVSKLRKLVGADVIASIPSGYVLEVDPGSVDAHRFEELLDAGRDALRDGDARTALRLLSECRALWRGVPLTDLADGAFRLGQSTRLAELWLLAAERRVEAELVLGHHRETVGELEALVAEHPFREALWGQLMVALYRSGRQADALRCFQRLRRVLADELGIEPSAPIVRLESQILRQDPQLDLQPLRRPTTCRRCSARSWVAPTMSVRWRKRSASTAWSPWWDREGWERPASRWRPPARSSTPMATACGGSISPPCEIPPPYRSRSPRFSARHWRRAPPSSTASPRSCASPTAARRGQL